jgi:hypothetical protein
MNDSQDQSSDEYLSVMKAARDSAAVAKLRLIKLAAEAASDALIFLFEGDLDKVIYFYWIQRSGVELTYEPVVVGGKREMKKIDRVLARDLSELARRVCFFMDRDFDDLDGFSNSVYIFMTDRYSIENYLVDEEVLQGLLRDEFSLDGHIETRNRIKEKFTVCYEKFLCENKDINLRLYLARKLRLNVQKTLLPDRISALANVEFCNVTSPTKSVDLGLLQALDLSDPQHTPICIEFAMLDPRTRYRGKFALLFFQRWLGLLIDECRSSSSDIFDGIRVSITPRHSDLTPGNFASRSSMPDGLREFLANAVHRSRMGFP